MAMDGFCPRVEEAVVLGSREVAVGLFRRLYALAVEAYRNYLYHGMRNV